MLYQFQQQFFLFQAIPRLPSFEQVSLTSNNRTLKVNPIFQINRSKVHNQFIKRFYQMSQEFENHTNSAKQRGYRPHTTEAEAQRRKDLSRPEMMSMNYHHSLSKLYLKAYNDTFPKVTVQQLRDFIGFDDQSFLDLLDMMTQDKFPFFSKNLSSDKAFMNQPIPLSLYDSLLRLRRKDGLDEVNKDKHLIRKSIIKQLHLITLLLNGIGQIDQKVRIIQQNQSQQTFFRRKVSWFLNRTTLLTPRVFYWYVMYWDLVMETVQRTLKEYDEEQKIEKKRGRKKKKQSNQVNFVNSNEEKSNNCDYEESMKTENLLSNFNYDQVEPNIHAAIEKLNYLKLRNKKPYEIDVQNNNDDDSELKIVERTVKQTYKRKLQEKILKKRQQNRKIKDIEASISQKYGQKSKTTQKQEKKKSKALKYITNHVDSQVEIIQKHPSTRQHCGPFTMGTEGPCEFVMKYIDPCEYQMSSLVDNLVNSEQPLNSTSIQNVSQSQRLRQNDHNINQMNPIITNLLTRRQVIGQTIATEIYYALINTNIRLIEQNKLIEKQPV